MPSKKSPYDIIFIPFVTEKTLDFMELENRLEFIVRRNATKTEIKRAFEELYKVKVAKVNTRILPTGKHAIIKLAEGYSAEDIGMRLGIF
jgi:large subunit ribosomal protein L23